MRKKLLAGLVMRLAFFSGGRRPYLLTFTGIVIQSTDNGAFGSPIGGLTGQSYKAEFQFDSLGAALLSTDTSTAKFYYGSGAQSPLSSAKLTINSVTYDFTPYFSQLSEENELGAIAIRSTAMPRTTPIPTGASTAGSLRSRTR